MGTAAKLLAEVAHAYHTYGIAVFLIKQSHGAALLRVLNGHDVRYNRKTCLNLTVNNLLNLGKFLSGYRLEMTEVETGTLCILIGTLLLDMVTENLTKCLLKKVRRAVVLACSVTKTAVNLERADRTGLDDAVTDYAVVRILVTDKLFDILYDEFAVSGYDDALIALLAAHGCIKRRPVGNNGAVLLLTEELGNLRRDA